MGGACATNGARDGVLAHDDLVSLVLDSSSGTEVLRLVPQPGVRINAQIKPAIDRPPASLLTFDAPGRTADSAYFVVPPTVSVQGLRPVAGTLRASACPEGKRVCRTVALAFELP